MKFRKLIGIFLCSGIFLSSQFLGRSQAQEDYYKFRDDKVVDYLEIYGKDRAETSIEVSKFLFKESKTVVVCDGRSFVSSISASNISSNLDTPVLINNEDVINKKVLDEISRLGAETAYYVYEDNHDKNIEVLKSKVKNVIPISGAASFEISLKAYKSTGLEAKKIVLASNNNFADGVSISSYSSKNGYPIFLVDSEISDEVAQKINSLGADEVIIAGGDRSISEASKEKINNSTRISGSDRYETSKMIRTRFFKDSKDLVIASGKNFADTVSALPLAFRLNTSVALVKNSSDDIKDSRIDKKVVVGGGVKKYSTDVVYINPHQDDESIDMGLDIIRDVKDGRNVYLILMTDGAKSGVFDALNGDLNSKGYSKISREEFVYMRNMEMISALKTMGVKRENIILCSYKNLELQKEDVIREIEKFENSHGNNFSYKTLAKNSNDKSMGNTDHFACYDGVKEFADKNNRSATYFSSKPKDETYGIVYRYPTKEEEKIWREALSKYGEKNYSSASYGVGYRSVYRTFEDKLSETVEYIWGE